jgi:hypothetical protein
LLLRHYVHRSGSQSCFMCVCRCSVRKWRLPRARVLPAACPPPRHRLCGCTPWCVRASGGATCMRGAIPGVQGEEHDRRLCVALRRGPLRVHAGVASSCCLRRCCGGADVCSPAQKHARELIAEKSVVELGSGTGVCGLFASQLGAASVLLTDDAEHTALLQRNADANREWIAGMECTVNVAQHQWCVSAGGCFLPCLRRRRRDAWCARVVAGGVSCRPASSRRSTSSLLRMCCTRTSTSASCARAWTRWQAPPPRYSSRSRAAMPARCRQSHTCGPLDSRCTRCVPAAGRFDRACVCVCGVVHDAVRHGVVTATQTDDDAGSGKCVLFVRRSC